MSALPPQSSIQHDSIFKKSRFLKLKQFLTYGAIGLGLNLVLYCVYLIIVALGANPKLSMTLVYTVGVALGFYSHKKITFSHTGSLTKSMIRFLIAHGIGYLINLACLFIFVDKFGFAHQLIQALTILLVALYLFIIFKFWVFSEIKKNAIT